MSQDFLTNPEYNPEGLDDIRAAIDTFFSRNPEAVVNADKPEAPVKKKKAKLKLPEAPTLGAEELTEAIDLAKEEIDCIREEFYEFQAAISHLAIYPYIYKDIEAFVNSCLELTDMVEDNIDVSKLSSVGIEDYAQLQKVRARLLSSLYSHYKDQE